MSYFLRAGFLVDALLNLEAGLKELDDLLNERDVDTEFAQLQALLKQRIPAGGNDGHNAREGWQRVRQAGLTVRQLLATAEKSTALLKAMPCEPLIFTGSGETDDVLRGLNQMLQQNSTLELDRQLGIQRHS